MPLHILHLHSTFDLGGKEARAVRLMNAFGNRARHTILTATPGALGARQAIAPGVKADFPEDAPSLIGKPSVGRYQVLAKYMRRFDLILSYNWGSMDGVMTRRIFPKGLPPLIHHEDGFNADEAVKLKTERNIFRRIALGTATALVVPSMKLEGIARTIWKQPDYRIHRISNGIAVGQYGRTPNPKALPRFMRRKNDVVIGTLAGLRSVKNLPLMVRAVAGMGMTARLVIVGEGPERDSIAAQAKQLGVDITLTGFAPNPHKFIGLFDIFALSSDSEQFPISLVEAMAAGLPVVATDVGDVRSMVSPDNLPYIVPRLDITAFSMALLELASNSDLRNAIGNANRAHAIATYDEADMIARYAALYGGAIGRSGALID